MDAKIIAIVNQKASYENVKQRIKKAAFTIANLDKQPSNAEGGCRGRWRWIAKQATAPSSEAL